jgi:hypothetical protein
MDYDAIMENYFESFEEQFGRFPTDEEVDEFCNCHPDYDEPECDE